MSYILDAMRKSERDATMGQQINLPSANTSWGRKLTYPIIGLVLVGFIAAALWLAINWQSAAPRTSLSASDAVAPAPNVASATPSHQTIEISIDPEPVLEPPAAVLPAASSTPKQPATAAKAISWRELPDMAQYINQLPENLLRLRIGIHVFDQTPSRRFLLIGGRRYQQGDELGGIDGAHITEITPDGIAIKYRNLHFHTKR